MNEYVFKHVCLESWAINTPPQAVSSTEIEDRLGPLFKRLEIPFGTLERLSGVQSRYFWPLRELPSAVATVAVKEAISKIGFDRKHLGAVFNCSVTRDYFEPSTACIIHRNIGLPEEAIAADISNACIGFSNGLLMLAALIEQGAVKAGIVSSGENVSFLIENSIISLLKNQTITRDQLLKILPSFTLGSGAVSYVLAHDSIATQKHYLKGAVARSATQFSDLCAGNADYCMNGGGEIDPVMHTESAKLMAAAAKLGGRVWPEVSRLLGWSREDVNHVFCHQVGKQVNEGFYRELGLDIEKEFTIYKEHGNLVSAALPTCFAKGMNEKGLKPGDKIICTAYGSGLNAIFSGWVW
jgi:3-oxoacyl-[acyl-carrier-protein] synthase-3